MAIEICISVPIHFVQSSKRIYYFKVVLGIIAGINLNKFYF